MCIFVDSSCERSDRNFVWCIKRHFFRQKQSTFYYFYHKGIDRQASEDHCLFGPNRKNFLLHSANPILVKLLSNLLFRVYDCNSKHTIVLQNWRESTLRVITIYIVIRFMLQSISTQDSDTIDSSSLMKAIVFYMAATVEAFIFCFCGEYLSAKVGMHKRDSHIWFALTLIYAI